MIIYSVQPNCLFRIFLVGYLERFHLREREVVASVQIAWVGRVTCVIEPFRIAVVVHVAEQQSSRYISVCVYHHKLFCAVLEAEIVEAAVDKHVAFLLVGHEIQIAVLVEVEDAVRAFAQIRIEQFADFCECPVAIVRPHPFMC